MQFALGILTIGLLFNSGYGIPAPLLEDADYPGDDTPKPKGKPVIVTQPMEIVAELSKDVALPCEVVNNTEEESIVWKFNNKNLFTDDFKLMDLPNYSTNKTHTLWISNFSSDLAGVYTCAIPHPQFPLGINHTVGLRQPVIIDNIHAKKYVDNLSELKLACRARGFPTPTITWTQKSSENSVEMDLNVKSPNYVSQVATTKDTGIYTCKADNGYSSDTKSVTVTVIDGLAPESAKVYAGEPESTTKLCCVFDYPREITWSRDNKLITSNDRFTRDNSNKHKDCLVITKVKEEDLGTYTCQTQGKERESAKVVLDGAPAKPVIKLIDSTVISWTTPSLLPISSYKIFVKKIGENDWKEVANKEVTAEDKKGEISHTFTNVENGQYSVKIEVSNKYGSNESVEEKGLVIDRYENNVVVSANMNSNAESHYRISSLCILFAILMRLWNC